MSKPTEDRRSLEAIVPAPTNTSTGLCSASLRSRSTASFRPTVFNVLAGNDDHGRNHAFLIGDDGTWRLSPAFDLTLATNPLTSGARAGRVLGKAVQMTRRDLLRLGEGQDVWRIPAVIDEVRDAISRWPEFAKEVELPAGQSGMIGAQLAALDLA